MTRRPAGDNLPDMWRTCLTALVAALVYLSVLDPTQRTALAQVSPPSDKVSDSPWSSIRCRTIPLPFYLDGSQPKVNMELLLLELLDESVFPTNPLGIDERQRTDLIRKWTARHQEIETRGFDLEAIVTSVQSQGLTVDWNKVAPGLNAYQEQRQTVRALAKVLDQRQVQLWQDMGIVRLRQRGLDFNTMLQDAFQRIPQLWKEVESQPRFNMHDLLVHVALEDLQLNIESYIQRARAFDGVIRGLTPEQRTLIDQYLKVDAFNSK